MKVCINTWALYNEALHLGTWCDLEDYEDAIKELEELQKNNGLGDDLEVFLADWDDDELDICNEGANLKYLKKVYEEYEGLDARDKKKMEYLVSMRGYKPSEVIDELDNCDIYENTTMEELAKEFVNEGIFGEIPNSIINYIDYNAIARDLSYDYEAYKGDIFRCD